MTGPTAKTALPSLAMSSTTYKVHDGLRELLLHRKDVVLGPVNGDGVRVLRELDVHLRELLQCEAIMPADVSADRLLGKGPTYARA